MHYVVFIMEDAISTLDRMNKVSLWTAMQREDNLTALQTDRGRENLRELKLSAIVRTPSCYHYMNTDKS